MPPTCSTTASSWPIPKPLLPPIFQAFTSPQELRDAVMQGAMDHSAFESAYESLSSLHRHMLFEFPLLDKARKSGQAGSTLDMVPEDGEGGGEGDMVGQTLAGRQAKGGGSVEGKTPVAQVDGSTPCLCAGSTQRSTLRVPFALPDGEDHRHLLKGFKLCATVEGPLLKSSRLSIGDNLASARQAVLRQRQNRDRLSSREPSISASAENCSSDGSPLDEITASARLSVRERRIGRQQRENLRDISAIPAQPELVGAGAEQEDAWSNNKKRNRNRVSLQIDAPSKKLREVEELEFDERKDSLDGL